MAGAMQGASGRPRSEIVRQRIMQAATGLLHEKGFRAMTIEGIAERAGAGKVTIYRWWSSKAAIVLEALLDEVGQQVSIRETGQPLEDLRDYMEKFAQLTSHRSGLALANLLAEGVLDPQVGQAFREHWLKPRRHSVSKLLARAQKAGLLADTVSMDTMLDMLFGPLYYRLLVQHAPVSRDFARSVWRTVIAGLTLV